MFCGITKQNHRSQCSGNSEMNTDDLRQMLKSIKSWHSKFVETDSVGDINRSGRPSVSDETVDAASEAFQHSPGKSTRRASKELHVPQSTVLKILHKRLKLYAYEVQIVQSLQLGDGLQRASFATEIMRRIDEDNDYLNLLKPNDIYTNICRTAALTSRRYILNIYLTNIHTEYFKHAA